VVVVRQTSHRKEVPLTSSSRLPPLPLIVPPRHQLPPLAPGLRENVPLNQREASEISNEKQLIRPKLLRFPIDLEKEGQEQDRGRTSPLLLLRAVRVRLLAFNLFRQLNMRMLLLFRRMVSNLILILL
jgi:hypothetical protein